MLKVHVLGTGKNYDLARDAAEGECYASIFYRFLPPNSFFSFLKLNLLIVSVFLHHPP